MNTGYYEMRVFAKDTATISAFEDEADKILKEMDTSYWDEVAKDALHALWQKPYKSIFFISKPIVYKNYYLCERLDFLNVLMGILNDAADKFPDIISAEIDHEGDEAKACLFETLYETAAFKIRNGLSEEDIDMFFD